MTKEEVLRKIEECLGNAKIPQPQHPKKVEEEARKAPPNAKSLDSLTGIQLPDQLDDDFSNLGAVLSQGPKLGRRLKPIVRMWRGTLRSFAKMVQ